MFTSITLATLILSGTASAQSPTHVPPEAVLGATAQTTEWSAVVAYFNAYATQRNPTAEAMLEEEAEEGYSTWVRVTGTSGGQARPVGLLDGPGVGWPSLGLVVGFATNERMNTAADLIEAVAASSNRRVAGLLRGNAVVRGARIVLR